ncbi:hypothetical protein P43SY_009599 [Pythium insidiosum]|uniref:RING-type domain-containing protein n=1 Tax=Pythium insidiosum TaxID=114742 RepID=A0AAD5M5V0_PYTIN|nr:hypothetical protein P43SY_009599 [Pythium insidiosum]
MGQTDTPVSSTAHDARVVLQLLEEIHELVASAGGSPSALRLHAAAKLYLDTRDAFEATELTVEGHVHHDRPKFLRKLSTRRSLLTSPRDSVDAGDSPPQPATQHEAADRTASFSSQSSTATMRHDAALPLSPRQRIAVDDASEALLDRIQEMFRHLGELLSRAILDELRQRHLSLQNVLHYVRFLPPAAQWTAYLEKRQQEVQNAFRSPAVSAGSPRSSVLMTTRLADLVAGSDASLRQLRVNAEFVKAQIRRDVDTVCLFSADGTMATIFGDDINSDLDSVADRFDLLVTEVYAPFLGAIISTKMEQLVRLSEQWQHDMAALMASPLTADAPLTQIYARPRKFRMKISVFPRRLTSVIDERNMLLSASGSASTNTAGTGAAASTATTPNMRVLVADADHVGMWWQKAIFSVTERDILTTHTDDSRQIQSVSETLDGQLYVPLTNESSHDFYRRYIKPHGGLAKWRGHRVLVNNGKDSLWVEVTITEVEDQRKCKLQLKRSLETAPEAAAWRAVLRNGEWINLRDLRLTLVPVNPSFRVHMGVKLRTMMDVIQTLVLEISSIFPNETLERRVTTALWQSLEPHVARGEHIYARYLRSILNQDGAVNSTTSNPLGRRQGAVERSPSLVLGAASMRNLVAALEHSTTNSTSTTNVTAQPTRPIPKMSVRSVGRRAESAVQIQVMPTLGRRSSLTISQAARQLARVGASMPYFDEKGAYHHQSMVLEPVRNPSGSGTSGSAATAVAAPGVTGIAAGGNASASSFVDGATSVLSTFEKLAHHLLEETEMIGPCMQANIIALSRAFAQVLQERLTKLVRTLQSRLDQDDTSGLDLTLVEYAQASRLAYVWRLARHELDAVARQRRPKPPSGGTNLHADWVDRTFDRMEDLVAAMLQLQAQYLHRALFHECTAYILPSVYEQDWRASKPWFGNSRCTYGVQFLIFRIESLLDDVVLNVLEHFERALGVHERLFELSGWLVVDAVACVAAAYEQMVTSRARASQWKIDVLYLVAGLHRILGVLDKMLAPKSPPPEFTQRGTKRPTTILRETCLRLLTCLAVRTGPADVVIKELYARADLVTQQQQQKEQSAVDVTIHAVAGATTVLPQVDTITELNAHVSALHAATGIHRSTFSTLFIDEDERSPWQAHTVFGDMELKYLADVTLNTSLLISRSNLTPLALLSFLRLRQEVGDWEYPPLTDNELKARDQLKERLWEYSNLDANVGTLQPSKRSAHSLVAYDDRLYVFGGIGDTALEEDHEFNDTWKFDLRGRTWSKVVMDNATKPSHRFHHATSLHENSSTAEMIVFGGLSISTTGSTGFSQNNLKITQYNDVWRLTLANGAESWTQDPGPASGAPRPAPRSEAAGVVVNDQLFIFGGISYDDNSGSGPTNTPVDFNDLWSYNLRNFTWQPITSRDGSAPPARFSHSMSTFIDKNGEVFLLVFSGRYLVAKSWALLGDVWVFSLRTQRWTAVELSARIQRAYTSLVMTPGVNNVATQMWFFGGYYKPVQGANGYVYDDVVNGQLSLERDVGRVDGALSKGSMKLYHALVGRSEFSPPLRYNHRAVLWKDGMIIHGGSYQTQRGDVWLYNLTTAVLRDDVSSSLHLDVDTLVYVLGALVLAILLLLVALVVRWRRIDRRNIELARMRGVTAMRGITRERLEQLEITKYKKPVRAVQTDAEEKPDETRHETSASEDVCPICLVEFEEDEDVRNLPCKHLFHVACIDEWLGRNTTCPMCKNNLDLEVVDVNVTVPAAATSNEDVP